VLGQWLFFFVDHGEFKNIQKIRRAIRGCTCVGMVPTWYSFSSTLVNFKIFRKFESQTATYTTVAANGESERTAIRLMVLSHAFQTVKAMGSRVSKCKPVIALEWRNMFDRANSFSGLLEVGWIIISINLS
jgi:hypothetical protein